MTRTVVTTWRTAGGWTVRIEVVVRGRHGRAVGTSAVLVKAAVGLRRAVVPVVVAVVRLLVDRVAVPVAVPVAVGRRRRGRGRGRRHRALTDVVAKGTRLVVVPTPHDLPVAVVPDRALLLLGPAVEVRQRERRLGRRRRCEGLQQRPAVSAVTPAQSRQIRVGVVR